MIKRDEYGIIGQHRRDEPDYLDMGDSCMKTSIAVIGGLCHRTDLFYFYEKGLVVRHPYDKEYNNPKDTSRDQLICLMAAKYLMGYHSALDYSCFINKDFLGMPDIQWFMRKCKGDNRKSWLGDKTLRASIWYAAKHDPDHELNQLFCICLVMGREYVELLCESHPDWRKNLTDYWGGWRDQPEIGGAFIKRIGKEL